MRTLRFYGASDDLFEIEGTGAGEPDEIGAINGAAVSISNATEGLIVTAEYAPGFGLSAPACWSIGICPLDEDVPLPEWPMRWSAQGYTTLLSLDVPDGVVVREVVEDPPK